MRAILRRLSSSLVSPFRRFFDPRFQAVYDLVAEDTRTTVDATAEAASITGRILHDLSVTVDSAAQGLERIEADLGALRSRFVDATSAPVGGFDERALVIAYVARALAELDAGARILGWGPTEDVVWSVLDALGYDVTRVEPSVDLSNVGDADAGFPAAVWLRSARDGSDVDGTLDELSRLTAPGALLVVRSTDEGGGTLPRATGRWRVEDARVLRRNSHEEWEAAREGARGSDSHVELTTGRRDDGRP